jgi:hypothetical protein
MTRIKLFRKNSDSKNRRAKGFSVFTFPAGLSIIFLPSPS